VKDLERFSRLFDELSLGVSVRKAEGEDPGKLRLLYSNAAAVEHVGMDVKAMVGKTIGESFPQTLDTPENQNIPIAWHRAATSGKTERLIEVEVPLPDGSVRWMNLLFMPLEENTAAAFIENVTDQVLAREAEEKVAQLSQIVEQTGAGIAVIEPDGTILYLNSAFAGAHGYGPDELIGKHVTIFHNEEQIPEVLKINKRIERLGEFSGEVWHTRRDGSVFPTWMHNSKLLDKDGRTIGMIGTLRDISDLKESEAGLRKQRDLAQRYLDISGFIIVALDREGKVTLINSSGCEALGCDPNEMVGQDWFGSFIPDNERQNVRAVFRELMAGQIEPFETHENEIVTTLGERRVVRWHNSYLHDDQGNIIGTLSSGEDVTERRESAEALAETQRAMSTLLSNLPGMAYRCRNDQDWTMEFVSDGCQDLVGCPPEDLLDNHKLSYASCVHPDDREHVWRTVQEALESQTPFQIFYRLATVSGQEKWVWEQGCGVFGDDGEVEALEGYVLDITERRKLEFNIEESAREIELYNDILTHDINNINQTTLTYLNLLLSGDFGELNQEQQSFLETCKGQIARCAALADKIKTITFVKEGRYDPESLDLDALMSDAAEALKLRAKGRPLEISFQRDRGKMIRADRLIHQVFFNLMENAFIHNRSESVRIHVAIIPFEKNERGHWRVEIEDNGQGIRDDLKKAIFDRFETAKERAGTGMGLAIAKALIRREGGRVFVENRVEDDHLSGSRFIVELPRA
jgi:PAS domain S-box-containing protein